MWKRAAGGMCSGPRVFRSGAGFAESEPEGSPGVGADTHCSASDPFTSLAVLCNFASVSNVYMKSKLSL